MTTRAALTLASALVGAYAPEALLASQAPGVPQAPPVVVASKPFAESLLLAEIFAQHLEARGFQVDRRPGLGATEIAFQALTAGAIDVYPEYTGTGLLSILDREAVSDAREAFRIVDSEFDRRWGVRWLPPLGFENTYAMAVRPETASELGLSTLSDLAQKGSGLVGGFSPDFIGREDGLPGLVDAYGLTLAGTRALLQSIKYEALVSGEVDVIDGYSTDGRIDRLGLVVLADDRRFFPPYEAAALVGARLWRERPEVVVALQEISGRFSEPLIRALNRRVEVDGGEIATVAREALVAIGLSEGSGASDLQSGAGREPESLLAYLLARRGEIGRLTARHLLLVGASLALAVLVAVPLGLMLERRREAAEAVIRSVGLLQTIPSIALLAFMIPLLGIGVGPALVALFLYSLFPIARNTYTGVRDADPSAVGAATAIGMTPMQVLRHVRLPLAAPVVMAGIRTAAVINVGTATLAAFIGAGGLGDPIVAGLALSDTRMILMGAIPAALLALVVDLLLGGVERISRPSGLG